MEKVNYYDEYKFTYDDTYNYYYYDGENTKTGVDIKVKLNAEASTGIPDLDRQGVKNFDESGLDKLRKYFISYYESKQNLASHVKPNWFISIQLVLFYLI